MAIAKDNGRSTVPPISNSEVENLLEEVAARVRGAAPVETATPKRLFKQVESTNDVHSSLLSPRQMRKVRQHQEGFASNLAARLSLFLRAEFFAKLTDIRLTSYQQMTESWPEPAHLTLFKTEPLRGVSIMQIPTSLGLCLVDRLMGGPGQASGPAREMSAIESALLEQVVQIFTGEWCRHCSPYKELKAVTLGYESNPRFLQTAPPQTTMLVIMLEAALGRCRERIQIGLPFAALEPFLRQLAPEVEMEAEPAPVAAKPQPGKWNTCFNDVRVPVAAEWQGLEVTAREVMNLKVGDVLKIDPQSTQQVRLRLGDNAKFHGRLGAISGNWAVELTEAIKL